MHNYRYIPFFASILALIVPLFYNDDFDNYYSTDNLLPLVLIVYLIFSTFKLAQIYNNENLLSTKTAVIYLAILIAFTLVLQNPFDSYYPLDFISYNASSSDFWEWVGLSKRGFFYHSSLSRSSSTHPDIGFYCLLVALGLPLYWMRSKLESLPCTVKSTFKSLLNLSKTAAKKAQSHLEEKKSGKNDK